MEMRDTKDAVEYILKDVNMDENGNNNNEKNSVANDVTKAAEVAATPALSPPKAEDQKIEIPSLDEIREGMYGIEPP